MKEISEHSSHKETKIKKSFTKLEPKQMSLFNQIQSCNLSMIIAYIHWKYKYLIPGAEEDFCIELVDFLLDECLVWGENILVLKKNHMINSARIYIFQLGVSKQLNHHHLSQAQY